MTEEEKKAIFEISKRIGYKVGTYCNEEEIEVFEKLLEDYKYKNNLIGLQQKEIKKKDKIIDLMADFIDENIDDCLLNILNIDEPCENYVGKNKKLCKYCIKQYFSMKVEDKQC